MILKREIVVSSRTPFLLQFSNFLIFFTRVFKKEKNISIIFSFRDKFLNKYLRDA